MGRKWNNIKMKKAAQDKMRSANYTKILREITMAVRSAGPLPESNFSLKIALVKAKENNVPRDNIERAIKKGSGEGGDNYEEINYEGYGLDGVAIFVEAATDNPTRTIGNIRSYFNRWGGAVGTQGCLQFVFERKAVFTVKADGLDVDTLTMDLIDAGCEDIESEDGYLTIKGAVESYGELHKKLEELKIKVEESGLERLPLNTKEVKDKDNYAKILKLVEVLEEDDDVQKVYHNMDFNEAFDS
ncbi:MAG: YebC/PmpR family DNA-binding transcriptional regulator [Bacteriovoracia bacterium]